MSRGVLIAIIVFALALGLINVISFAFNYFQGKAVEKELLALSAGMSEAEVTQILGAPRARLAEAHGNDANPQEWLEREMPGVYVPDLKCSGDLLVYTVKDTPVFACFDGDGGLESIARKSGPASYRIIHPVEEDAR